MRAALFDMDRTLVRKETGSLFVRYQLRVGEARRRDLLRVLYWVAQYTVGVIDAEAVAARVALSLEGTDEAALAARCDDWFRLFVEPHVCDLGRVAVDRHVAQGEIVAIVTGATSYAARPLARRLGIPHVVASELEVDDRGVFTGRFAPPLCYGLGKVERARVLSRELGFSLAESTFYSDSYTDLPLLEAVAEPIVVNPDPRLARIAKERRWRIERW